MRAKPTLKANFANGEGEIGNLEKFNRENDALMRADLLQDWIGLLTHEYTKAVLEMRKGNY